MSSSENESDREENFLDLSDHGGASSEDAGANSDELNVSVHSSGDVSDDSQDSKMESIDGGSRKRKAYTTGYKLQAVEYAKKNSKRAASKKFRVSRSVIKRWMETEDDFHKLGTDAKRNKGGGRRAKYPDLEKQLYEWVKEQRGLKIKVSRRLLKIKALSLRSPHDSEEEFVASEGWLSRFMKRFKLSARRATTQCQKLPSAYEQKIIDFIIFVGALIRKNKYQHVYAADETAVFLDPVGGKCLEQTGTKEVSVKTTGHEKLRITVILTARMDGFKCKPYVMLHRKRPVPKINDMFKGKLVLNWAGNTWMNDVSTEDYLDKVMSQTLFGSRLLIWDSFRAHISERTKKVLKRKKIDTAVIPGGCTKFVQAPDVCWNAPFKAKIRQLYEDWMLHATKEVTSSGNPRAPPMEVYLSWIVEAWESLSTNTVKESFSTCGIGIKDDGSEDDKIHCFKAHGPIPSGKKKLEDARANAQLDDIIRTFKIELDDSEADEESAGSQATLDFEDDD